MEGREGFSSLCPFLNLCAAPNLPCTHRTMCSLKGIPALQHALATVMERTFLQGYKLDPGLLVAQAGCGSILDHLFFCLCDAEEGVLIPAPYYPAFDNDLTVRAGGPGLWEGALKGGER